MGFLAPGALSVRSTTKLAVGRKVVAPQLSRTTARRARGQSGHDRAIGGRAMHAGSRFFDITTDLVPTDDQTRIQDLLFSQSPGALSRADPTRGAAADIDRRVDPDRQS